MYIVCKKGMNRTVFYYSLTLAGFFGLLGLLVLWSTWLSPPVKTPIAFFLLMVTAPLLLPARGLLAGNDRSFFFIALLSLPYFTHGLVEAYAGKTGRWPAIAEILLSLLLFFGAAGYVRFRKR